MRLFSPVVLAVALAIAGLGVAVLVLQPDLWMRAVLALAFLPVAAVLMKTLANRQRNAETRRRAIIRIRASMVGGGALLISALGFAVAESQGWVADEGGLPVVSLVLVLVVVFGDLLAARMEKAADQSPDSD